MKKPLILTLLMLFFWPTIIFAQQRDFAPDEIIVKFKSKGSMSALGKAAANAQVMHKKSWNNNLHHFSMKTSDNMSDVLERLRQDPNVEYAEPNFLVYSDAQAYSATSAAIKVVESWAHLSATSNSDKPIIAILDSGLDLKHDIYNGTGRVWENQVEIPNNGYDDDGNGYRDDINGWNFKDNNGNLTDESGHGTHVAGIALGVSEDLENFDPADESKVLIMPLKFLNGEGVGKTSDAIEAIYYAVDNGARVISNSWGGANYSSALHEALTYAYSKGLIIISAAGNFESDNDALPLYPASYDIPSMISVAATTNSDMLASFSNYGVRTVHIAAPGTYIYSTIPSTPSNSNRFGLSSGTSMAAPFISGLAAVLLREAPQLTGYQIKQNILESGRSIPGLSSYVSTSKRMDAESSVLRIKTNNKSTMPSQPDYSPVFQQGSRGLASTNMAQGFGCGTVREMYNDRNNQLGNKNSPKVPTPLVVFLLSLPLVLVVGLKYKYRQHDRRNHSRKKVLMQGQLVTENGFITPVQVLCWSAGGAGIQLQNSNNNSELKLEKEQNLTLRIKSRVGSVIISSAKIVRKDDAQGFLGVQFDKTKIEEQ